MPKEPIVGRKKERELLTELLGSNKAEFIAVYGRRRVGKTYLIRNFLDKPSNVFFHVTGMQDGSLKEQLSEFSRRIGDTFYHGTELKPSSSWMDALYQLTQAIKTVPPKKQVVLFFDELPWMATPKSKLLSALALYWNRDWVFDRRIKLVICGSSTSWIIDNIINNKGGLYNRVTRSIRLTPFSLPEIRSLLQLYKIKLSERQVLDLYMVLGGIPLYWSFLQKGKSGHQNIDKLCFQPLGPLVHEFDRLFASLFDDPEPYEAIMRVIAKHRHGIPQNLLMKEAKISSGGYASKRLKQLEQTGFITGWVPYGNKEKGIHYKIDDEYSLFYLRWIEPNRRKIESKALPPRFWESQSSSPSWKSWSGLAFESVCFKHLHQIWLALDLPNGSTAGSWRYIPKAKSSDEGAQIDLLFDRPDGSITVCEIKCVEGKFAIDKAYAKDLMRKLDVFAKQAKVGKELFLSMITISGLKKTMYSEELIDSDATLKDLFKEDPFN